MNSDIQTVHVNLSARSYEISIGQGILSSGGPILRQWLAKRHPSMPNRPNVLMTSDAAISSSHAQTLRDSLEADGWEVSLLDVPSGEASKSTEQLIRVYDALAESAADRNTPVIAVGGGVIGDLSGFAAATYNRGIPFFQVPTTLLSQVDSSVGGKTGINHPRGKNLIGAFHQPHGVLVDTDTLSTLNDRDYRSGLAEVVKYGVILDADFFETLEQNIDGLIARDHAILRSVVARCCRLKADVVEQDEQETTGLRAILNYGHTYAHAFEALAGYGTLLHGEAVSLGMLCASRLAESLGRITGAVTQRQLALLTALGLPVSVPADLTTRTDDILSAMRRDKKTVSGSLRFILPTRIGHVETVHGVPDEAVIAALS